MSVNTQVVFTPYEVKACLMDEERTRNLQTAIIDTVKKGDVVLEAGGGTGVLSMFALQAGAKHVYVIEFSPRFTNIIRTMAKANGFEDRITVINGDATETDIPENVDVYMSELLCTGLFNEPQIQAYNNCRRFFKEDTLCIPRSVKSTIEFTNANEYMYGLKINFDSYLAKDIGHHALTSANEYMNMKFDGSFVDPKIRQGGYVTPITQGEINSMVIRSSAVLSDDVDAGQTDFLFNPELIFFKNTWTMGTDISEAVTQEIPNFVIGKDTSVVDFEIEYEAGCDTLDVNMRVF